VEQNRGRLENADSQSAQRMKAKQVIPGLLDTKHAVAHMDQDPWQRYLEAARHAAPKSRAGASWAINAHCDALQSAEFVPVMPSPRMLLPSASADDQTREPRATTSQESSNEHVDSAPDLAAIKHALELGLILATLIIATIMIVAAAHDDERKLTPDITIGQVIFTPA
jgi:hypothetical protein